MGRSRPRRRRGPDPRPAHIRRGVPGDSSFVQRGLHLRRLRRREEDARWAITEWHQDARWGEGNRAVKDRDD